MPNYTDLLAAVPQMVENTTVDLATFLPSTLIPMAEFRMSRDLNVDLFDTVQTGTFTVGNNFFTRPQDLNAPRYLQVQATNSDGVLEWKIVQLRELEYLLEGWPLATDLGVPLYYAVRDATSYQVAPTPDGLGPGTLGAYPYRFGYKRVLAPLTANNQSNALTDNYYDALVAACCAEAARYVIDDRQASLIGMWESRYNQAVLGINAQQTEQERDDFRADYIRTDNRVDPR